MTKTNVLDDLLCKNKKGGSKLHENEGPLGKKMILTINKPREMDVFIQL